MSLEIKKKGFYSDPILTPDDLNPEAFSHGQSFSFYEGKTGWYRHDLDLTDNVLGELYNGGYIKHGTEEVVWPTYNLNDFRFRSDDWTTGEEGAIFLGCSDIFGVGNYYEKTAAYIVSNRLGVKNYNLGVPGGGLDQAYKYLKYHISDIKGKYVFLTIPEIFRRELFSGWKSVMVQAPSLTNGVVEEQLLDIIDVDKLREVYFKLLANPHYVTCQTSKNIDAIKYLCRDYDKMLIYFENPFYSRGGTVRNIFLQELKKDKTLKSTIAADQKHFGWPYQKFLADTMLNLIGKKL